MGRRGRAIFGDQGHVFFITTTVMNFERVFDHGEQYYLILLNSLKHVLAEHRAALFGYVFMPSHIHLVVALPEGEHISDMIRDFKKYTSTKIRQQLEQDGYAESVERLREHARGRKQVFKLWMDRFDDVVLYDEEMLRVKITYIHENPVRAGLVERAEDWKFSSARNYVCDDQSLIYVATDWQLVES